MFRPEPIFEPHPAYPSCHAATVVDLDGGGLLAAWFAGTHEGHPDVAIWLSHYDGGGWGEPLKVADEPDVPLWNPVLYRDPAGVVWLFYKVGPDVPAWTGVYMRSLDGGQTWSAPTLLPAGLLGPAKNKPVALSNGDMLCGASNESWRAWACWVEIAADGDPALGDPALGRLLSRHGPIVAPGFSGREAGSDAVVSATWDAAAHQLVLPQAHAGVIQPTVWEYAPGRLKMLMRSTQRVGVVCAAESDDYGRTWAPAYRTEIPHSNSGLDAVRLSDGRIVLACNPTRQGRTPLSLLVSEDNGVTWPWRRDVERGAGEYSYPSIVQAADGQVHVVYTYRRTQIRHLAVDPDALASWR